ncbi:MAG: hypothetical protein IE926_09880 [Micrococcales bacterium]|uniref:hypothetical protein n=1 Tax=Phycicoccus sp. TaxID=1902410 RepID=UPI0019BA4D12|nr:hypothetical protein [Phycicoccus sp.]MBD3783245.1 hypothetical protein [Micrococcales bacterium]HMM96275.1 hypothetical protein [Phycicoccus sp.]
MRFVAPPTWPPMPEGWLPDPGWKPEPGWPAAPRGWQFWRNDYGVAVPGPEGLYGTKPRLLTGHGIVLAVATGLLGFYVGVGGGFGAHAQDTAPARTVVSTPGPTPSASPSVSPSAP